MKNRWEYFLTILLTFAVWYLTAIVVGDLVLPKPLTVMEKLFSEAHTIRFWKHMGASSFRVLTALAASFVTAVPLGLFLGLSPEADRFAKPLIYMSYPVPKIVLMPIVMLIFGLGDLGKIIMLTMILFFQLLITTRDASRGVSQSARYSLLSLGGTKRHLFMHVIWPSCLPSVLTALRIATGTVVAVLFFIESIGTRYGMGFYIIDSWGRADIPQIFVGVIMLAALGIAMYEAFDLLERFCCKWSKL